MKAQKLLTISKKVPTPFYVYDLDMVEERVATLRAALPGSTGIHYAMKANSNLELLRFLKKTGVGVDTVSGGEIERALRAGFKPTQILFSGVGKTESELRLALKLKIKLVNVESTQELERLGRLAQKLKRKIDVGLRLNPDEGGAGGHPYISTGAHENKFGMAFADLPELKRILRRYRSHVSLEALDVHIGSQMLKLTPLERAIKRTIPVFKALRGEGFPLTYFDIGGGVGVRYKNETPIRLKDYGQLIKKLLGPLDVKILCEPGRVLVAESGTLITEVQYIKKSPKKMFAIVDTGMHHLLRPALYGAYHEVSRLTKNFGSRKVYDVVGPICESSDVLAEDRRLPTLTQGDLLAISTVGAYGFSMSSNYNLQPPAAEVLVRRGQIKISRP